MAPLDRAPVAKLERFREGPRLLYLHKQREMNQAGAMLRAAAMRCL
jgi:hypothetical protein